MSSADDGDGLADPWFAPGPKLAAPEADTAEWFLRAGRAGLLPDSMTESRDGEDSVQAQPVTASGAPPWGRDSASAADDDELPPWENGPWPYPGETAAPQQPPPAAGDPEPGRERPRSRLIMAAGAALVLIVAIVVIVVATSGGSATGCATYPASVRQAYSRAMSDLSRNATASVLGADLERAASVANAAAAAAGQLTARTALFAMANDLDSAHSDVTKHRPVASDLQQRLTADGTALPRSCPG